ncbi:MAG: class I SAM-dependent methyltransferase [Steroidobacteraceae bacterium]
MTKQRNPQAEQMADESMVRNLAAQAEAIWPQEEALFARYGLGSECRIADIGCGTGEITVRLAAAYSRSEVVGVDLLEELVGHARRRHAALAPRARFEQGDAFELGLPSAYFDLVVCRHMTQLVPEPEKVLSELKRICKPGGWLHVLSEDYGMLHMIPGAVDPDRLWHEGAIAYLRDIHTDGAHRAAHLHPVEAARLAGPARRLRDRGHAACPARDVCLDHGRLARRLRGSHQQAHGARV